MPGRAKLAIRLTGLSKAWAGHAGRAADPWVVIAHYEHVAGPEGTGGRDLIVTQTFAEVADLLGAIPVSVIEDPEDFRHLVRTMDLLRRNGKAVTAEA